MLRSFIHREFTIILQDFSKLMCISDRMLIISKLSLIIGKLVIFSSCAHCRFNSKAYSREFVCVYDVPIGVQFSPGQLGNNTKCICDMANANV